MASLVKRGKKYYVKYYDAAGKQRQVKGYTDRAETLKLGHRLENEKTAVQRGDVDPQTEAKKAERVKGIDRHIAEYKLFLQAKGNTANHVAYTIGDLEKFVAFSGVKHAVEITRPAVDRWRMDLMEKGKDSRRTINRRVGSLQAFLRQLQQTGGVTEYVLYRYPKLQVLGHAKRRRRSLEPGEADLLVKAGPQERRDMYRFALLSGLRLNEIRSMTPASFDLRQKTIKVRSKDPRHKDRVDVVPLHDDLVLIVTRRCEGKAKTEHVFDVPEKEMAARILREDCKAAGIDTTDIDFHALRHTFVTRLAEANVHPKIAQSLARHANVETTLKYYTHFRTQDERRALAAINLAKELDQASPPAPSAPSATAA